MTTIMITGAGSGLNNGAALELAERGYDVIACVEIYPQVRALEMQAKERGVNLRIEKIDVTWKAIVDARCHGTSTSSSTVPASLRAEPSSTFPVRICAVSSQFEPSVAFGSIVDVITGKSQLFRNVVTPDLAEGVRQQSLQVWTRKTADGLGTRAELVQRSYDLKPETLVGSK